MNNDWNEHILAEQFTHENDGITRIVSLQKFSTSVFTDLLLWRASTWEVESSLTTKSFYSYFAQICSFSTICIFAIPK